MNWLHYLLESNIYLGVFYALYFLLFGKETYYKLNRVYLLCAPILSYIIPLVQIGWLKSYEDGGQVTATIIYNPHLHQKAAATAYFTWQNILVYGYILGAAIMLILFTFKILQLFKLTRTQKDVLNNKYKLVKVEDANTAFSFFNYVFIGTNVSGADTMIRHELVHIDQKHSVDIVFLELVKIINWFNPFIYLLQRSLKTVHEYIADEQTAAYENDTLTYSSFLVSNAYGLSGSSISNSFFNYNLLKKRIIMLNQKRSGNLARLKYLAVIPIGMGLLCMSTLAFSKTYGWINILPANNHLAIKQSATKNPDTTVLVKLSADKRIPPPPPPARPKKVKSADVVTVTDVKLSELPKNVKPADVVKLRLSDPARLTASNKSGDMVTKTDVKLAQAASPSSNIQSEINKARSNAEKSVHQKMPPPPMAPFKSPANEFEQLSKYSARSIKYPASARKSKLVG
ncbi:MAG: M56 family metallopeptidase, partial [Mucilaginibacter sp.]